MLLNSGLTVAAQKKLTEYDVKAAYLFNFGKFFRVSPPVSSVPRQTFDICVVGQDPIGAALDEVAANEQIDRRRVRIRNVKAAAEARTCDIAYFGASRNDRIESDIADLRNSSVLTASDVPAFLARGGMIRFVPIANHVRFEVNLEAVRRAHLVLSSELLRVAVSVSGAPGEVER